MTKRQNRRFLKVGLLLATGAVLVIASDQLYLSLVGKSLFAGYLLDLALGIFTFPAFIFLVSLGIGPIVSTHMLVSGCFDPEVNKWNDKLHVYHFFFLIIDDKRVIDKAKTSGLPQRKGW